MKAEIKEVVKYRHYSNRLDSDFYLSSQVQKRDYETFLKNGYNYNKFMNNEACVRNSGMAFFNKNIIALLSEVDYLLMGSYTVLKCLPPRYFKRTMNIRLQYSKKVIMNTKTKNNKKDKLPWHSPHLEEL